MNILIILLSVIVSTIFVSTGVSKIVSKENFFNLNKYCYKFIGVVELSSAFFIFYSLYSLFVIVVLLFIYSVYLGFYSNSQECNCGGILDKIKLSRKQSLLRNLFLVGLTVILFLSKKTYEIELDYFLLVLLFFINILIILNIYIVMLIKSIMKELVV